MNHLCNSHCEFCGTDIIEELEGTHESPIFSILLVSTQDNMPAVLDYGFQKDFSASLCESCAHMLLANPTPSYNWRKCHCCGVDTHKTDISAFRITELEASEIEEHPYKGDIYTFVSSDLIPTAGPHGYTVCMSCVIPELLTTSSSGEEVLAGVIEAAVKEEDVYEVHLENLA